jgi:hypothetical protein
MATRSNYNTISDLATAVFDNGRRGSPKPGCDCVQCFGYCIVDQAVAEREGFARRDEAKHVVEDIQ